MSMIPTQPQLDIFNQPIFDNKTVGITSTTNTNGLISSSSAISSASISVPNQHYLDQLNINEYHNVIQGKETCVVITRTEEDILKFKELYGDQWNDFIKKDLVQKLVDEMAKNKQIEFTWQTDVNSAENHFRARIFATPDSQVKILREFKKKVFG